MRAIETLVVTIGVPYTVPTVKKQRRGNLKGDKLIDRPSGKYIGFRALFLRLFS
jgi:hypothetical protein